MIEYFGELAGDRYGTDDGRPPLVLLHGLAGDRRQWDPVLRELAVLAPDRRIVRFDLPGHGDSKPRATYGIDELTAVLHTAVTEAGLEAPVIVGHSFGGVLATAYGALHSVQGVVNVDQPLLAGGFAARLRQAEPMLRGPEYRQVWESLMAGMGIDGLPADVRDALRAYVPHQEILLGYWAELLDGSIEEIDLRHADELATIHRRGIAYHHVAGAEPAAAYREWLESSLPGVTITVLSGGGHFPQLARPADFAKILVG